MHNTLNALLDIAIVESWAKQSGVVCEEVVDPHVTFTTAELHLLSLSIIKLAITVNAQYVCDI